MNARYVTVEEWRKAGNGDFQCFGEAMNWPVDVVLNLKSVTIG